MRKNGGPEFECLWYPRPLYPLNGVFVFSNILFRFQFRDCEGNTLQLYCVPNSEKSHSYMSIERVLRGEFEVLEHSFWPLVVDTGTWVQDFFFFQFYQ